MKNHVDYFEKIIKILKELRRDYPDIDVSKHYSLATDCGNFLDDKELFLALQKYRGELEMNTVNSMDTEKIIKQTEELFKEVDEFDQEDDWQEEDEEEF